MNVSIRIRRWGGTLVVLAATVLLLVATPGATSAGGSARAAAKPDCNANPDACKTASVGQAAHRAPTLIAARIGKSKCQAWVVERYGKSAAGIKLWSWYLDVRWCYRRGRITSAEADPRPDTHVPLWSYEKQLAFRRSGGKRKSFYRVFAQGQFEFCVTKLGCIQDAQPWIRFNARGDGSHDYDAGG